MLFVVVQLTRLHLNLPIDQLLKSEIFFQRKILNDNRNFAFNKVNFLVEFGPTLGRHRACRADARVFLVVQWATAAQTIYLLMYVAKPTQKLSTTIFSTASVEISTEYLCT